MNREQMRAGDSDREAVAQQLKAALDQGRLDLHEYDERLQQTYTAKTFGDLDPLVTDLPEVVPAQRSRLEPVQPSAEPPASAERVETRGSGVSPFLASYGGVVLVCFIIWGVSCFGSGRLIHPWPVWMLIPLVFGMMGRRNR